MSSLTNINNNASVVNVGRTTPVSPGQQTSDKSIPVVIASDQEPIPVVEQNKVVSEVALSLLGIPRSEVALGIFADVNTYDVNPTEWSASPLEYTVDSNTDGWGVKHLPDEAGALIEAPKDKSAVLTSNRFFRYQPGRVSAATFGVKSTISPTSNAAQNKVDLNPSIRKFGIFDKFDGYYWETRADGEGDNFSVVRRTQSLLRNNPVAFGTGTQFDDHGVSGKAADVYAEEPNAYPSATKFLLDNRFKIIETAFAAALAATGGDLAAATALAALSAADKAKCKRDMDLAMEAYILDLQYGGNAHSIANATTYRMAAVPAPTVEVLVHTKLAQQISSQLGTIGETNAANRVYVSGASNELSYWTILAVNNPATRPNSSEIDAASYGSRNKIATIFAIYSKFLGYMGSEYTFNDSYGIISILSYATSTTSLSADEIKYRCYRDITYIVKGYGEDLQFGGNASTLYNAKRYYFNGIQIYSQTSGGVAAEIKRHEFIKKLLTGVDPVNGTQTSFLVPSSTGKTFTPVITLFGSTIFDTVAVTKLNDLCNKIIANFQTPYVGDIEYGKGSNYGDLVVLRDGLIMTHAAAFDPTLLKATKNVVVKPGFAVSNTNSQNALNNATTITMANASGITMGMTVSASTVGVQPGTYVTNVNGTSITLSLPLTAAINSGNTISFGTSTLEVSQDEFIVGQYINFVGTAAGANSNNLTANKLYKVEKVRGNRGNIITVSDATVNSTFNANVTVSGNPINSALLTILNNNPNNVVLGPGVRIEGKGLPEGSFILAAGAPGTWTISSISGALPSTNLSNIEITKISIISPDVNPSNPTLIYINPNVPFVFPKEYFYGKVTNGLKKPDGLFPLLYGLQGLPATAAPDSEKVGYIDTSIISGIDGNPALVKQQIETVNLLYNNWVKQNVDPRYYSVYEYRVPRSRFSTDQLNGSLNKTVYSDVATDAEGQKVYAGRTVLNSEGSITETKSVWKIDFTKVTMLKVEFSWYGAVGALFLAYVPVGNGEARWVRVHHLRASNQLKISSLGNATLPITYLVYGGGSVSRLGIDDPVNKGYTKSNHVVKYGASYYIDGGDRGTVRLYSHSTSEATNVYGSRFNLTGATVSSDSIGTFIDVTNVNVAGGGSNLPTNKTFFMKSKLITGSRSDQNVEIIWVDGNKLYINKDSLISQNSLFLISNRPSVVFGLKAKQNILNSVGTGVRNRVQVYPTKLSTSSNAPVGVTSIPRVKLQLTKTPLFQPNITPTQNVTFTLSADYIITPTKEPLQTSSTTYFSKDGESLYGWFRANVGTVFGMLSRKGSRYYFDLLETYSEEIKLLSGASFKFLADGRFSFNGDSLTGATEDTIQKERLSSVFISTQIQAPVPKTGTEVASFYLENGADLFDLLNYFDYNKDYLSFPLTDKVESVYLLASSTQASTGTTLASSIAEVNSSLTWEEQ